MSIQFVVHSEVNFSWKYNIVIGNRIFVNFLALSANTSPPRGHAGLKQHGHGRERCPNFYVRRKWKTGKQKKYKKTSRKVGTKQWKNPKQFHIMFWHWEQCCGCKDYVGIRYIIHIIYCSAMKFYFVISFFSFFRFRPCEKCACTRMGLMKLF